MLSLKDRKHVSDITVGDLIILLESYNTDTKVAVCGADEFFIHVEEDESAISFDYSGLDSDYNEWGQD